MQLYTICKFCKKDISIKSRANTRPDLEKEKGEIFNVQCGSCHKNDEKHVNDINARDNNTFLLGGIGITFIFTMILWQYFGAVSTVTAVIPVLMFQQQNSVLRAFNGYRIRRTK